ncbi:MAG: CesT family type III secretion system chaperone [Chlamydiales bacterium]|nr:CesT family type III secretion system chaperone [Chlamydiales bacterium]
MHTYEELIATLGNEIGVELHADERQTCRIEFPGDDVVLQVDLDTRGDRIVVGSQLAEVPPGIYREQLLMHALRVNALPRKPKGILAFSEKNDALVLFQYLNFDMLDAQKLHNFLREFVNHARLWREALTKGDLPQIEQGPSMGSSGMMGMR